MTVIFTDLDGTLLDHDTYAWGAAEPGVHFLNDHGVPLVLVTSKTRAEVEHWRRVLRNDHPFAIEFHMAFPRPQLWMKMASASPVEGATSLGI
jgi:predicted mannosyl-3-phosphoglycerate phosphatase (HAD superfamily)